MAKQPENVIKTNDKIVHQDDPISPVDFVGCEFGSETPPKTSKGKGGKKGVAQVTKKKAPPRGGSKAQKDELIEVPSQEQTEEEEDEAGQPKAPKKAPATKKAKKVAVPDEDHAARKEEDEDGQEDATRQATAVKKTKSKPDKVNIAAKAQSINEPVRTKPTKTHPTTLRNDQGETDGKESIGSDKEQRRRIRNGRWQSVAAKNNAKAKPTSNDRGTSKAGPDQALNIGQAEQTDEDLYSAPPKTRKEPPNSRHDVRNATTSPGNQPAPPPVTSVPAASKSQLREEMRRQVRLMSAGGVPFTATLQTAIDQKRTDVKKTSLNEGDGNRSNRDISPSNVAANVEGDTNMQDVDGAADAQDNQDTTHDAVNTVPTNTPGPVVPVPTFDLDPRSPLIEVVPILRDIHSLAREAIGFWKMTTNMQSSAAQAAEHRSSTAEVHINGSRRGGVAELGLSLAPPRGSKRASTEMTDKNQVERRNKRMSTWGMSNGDKVNSLVLLMSLNIPHEQIAHFKNPHYSDPEMSSVTLYEKMTRAQTTRTTTDSLKAAEISPTKHREAPETRMSARSFLSLLLRKAKNPGFWDDDHLLQDFRFMDASDEAAARKYHYNSCMGPEVIEVVFGYMRQHLAVSAGFDNTYVVFEGDITQTSLDEEINTPAIGTTGVAADMELRNRPLISVSDITYGLRYCRRKNVDNLIIEANRGNLSVVAKRIIRVSPQVLYPGNPILILLFTILPRKIILKHLAAVSISVPANWYEDMVQDALDAFVYLEVMPSFEVAFRTFTEACQLLQGSESEGIELSHGSFESDGPGDCAKRPRLSKDHIATTTRWVRRCPAVDDRALVIAVDAGLAQPELEEAIKFAGTDEAREAMTKEGRMANQARSSSAEMSSPSSDDWTLFE
ncbi:hypothetical protein EK21DRAFT_89502 [Setomelanomma holmii]|uniref:Uncharacterized protein n=1 Tax=Setomelanomma holmii TaxID=210430 RepID=A0A9P4LMI4_9PLEO|nr:hypothetical protein EK21DRAFT_89502 [Setomelanomma holmii]